MLASVCLTLSLFSTVNRLRSTDTCTSLSKHSAFCRGTLAGMLAGTVYVRHGLQESLLQRVLAGRNTHASLCLGLMLLSSSSFSCAVHLPALHYRMADGNNTGTPNPHVGTAQEVRADLSGHGARPRRVLHQDRADAGTSTRTDVAHGGRHTSGATCDRPRVPYPPARLPDCCCIKTGQTLVRSRLLVVYRVTWPCIGGACGRIAVLWRMRMHGGACAVLPAASPVHPLVACVHLPACLIAWSHTHLPAGVLPAVP